MIVFQQASAAATGLAAPPASNPASPPPTDLLHPETAMQVSLGSHKAVLCHPLAQQSTHDSFSASRASAVCLHAEYFTTPRRSMRLRSACRPLKIHRRRSQRLPRHWLWRMHSWPLLWRRPGNCRASSRKLHLSFVIRHNPWSRVLTRCCRSALPKIRHYLQISRPADQVFETQQNPFSIPIGQQTRYGNLLVSGDHACSTPFLLEEGG